MSSGDNWCVLNYSQSLEEIQRILYLYNNKEIDSMVYDCETTGFKPWHSDLIMFSLAHTKDHRGFSIPLVVTNHVHHADLPYEDDIPILDFTITPKEKQVLMQAMKKLLMNVPIIGHNLKFDTKWACWKGILDYENINIKSDTFTKAFQILGQQPKGGLALDSLSNRFLNMKDDWAFEVEDYLSRFRLIKDRHYGQLPTGLLGKYAAKDAIYNLLLDQKLDEKLLPSQKTITDMVTYAIKPFTEIENKGIYYEKETVDFLTKSYSDQQQQCFKEIYELPYVKKYIEDMLPPIVEENERKKKNKRCKPLPDEELRFKAFSITSNKNLQEIVYGENYYDMDKNPKFMTPGGAPQVNKDAFDYFLSEILSNQQFQKIQGAFKEMISEITIPVEKERYKKDFHSAYGKLLEFKHFLSLLRKYKRINKLVTTYINPVPRDSFDGLYKPEFNLVRVRTGRLSSGFHTLPNSCDIKRMYCSRWEKQGGLFVADDQSQLEMRVGASLSNETRLIEAYQKGFDVHKLTGSRIYKTQFEAVTDAMRSVGKTTNFAVFYGKTAKSLADDLNKTIEEAQGILDGFFTGYDILSGWMEDMRIFARGHGYIETPWGRRIPIPECLSTDKWEQLKGDRLAVNYPVQSSASDLVLESVIKRWERIKQAKMSSLIVGSVHDSIENDVYPGELFNYLKIAQEESVTRMMERHQDWLKCPLEISVEIGKSWGGALESKIEELKDDKVVFKSEGLRYDFQKLEEIASRAYKVKVDVLDRQEVTEFPDDIFVRDQEKWEARVFIEKRSVVA